MKLETKSIVFQSSTAFSEWKQKNKDRVAVLSISTPEIIIGYNVSQALINPNITVTYMEFS